MMNRWPLMMVRGGRAPRYHARPPVNAGFTLVELMVVLVLAGAILGLVLPKTGLTATLPSTSRQLIGAVRDAFTAASVTQTVHRLNFDLTDGRYWITQVTTEGDQPPTDPLLAKPVTLSSRITLQDVSTWQQGKVSTGRATIQFFPAGRAESAAIHLGDSDQNVMTLLLNPLTGHVQILDRYIDPPGPEPIPERLRPWFLLGFSASPVSPQADVAPARGLK
ncbi:MAG: prepilin-type N-terminal cleavage/methylation domain-containing protein [Nitrospirota bacterium]|nr:prepilin-type N-terminal cleavage/methylation domain-containing protein [Nitrospirota bacterium]MDE3225498.1 prepilin-type N-terminal cleavage/methylation domain-containing protein [Nitrospirota bacterium]MDE3242853.1 prepilin-type N-terminal cleavage/methylation domain-containing protein [Nitrospirota bacterium]